MSYLKGKSVYLSAAIECDIGPDWRPQRIKELTDQFGLNIFNPFFDEKQQDAPSLKIALEHENYDKAALIAKRFDRS